MLNKRKDIIATVEKFPNYIFHILAVAKINYNSDYANKYRWAIEHQDLEYLYNSRKLLEFGNGSSSDLTYLFIFLPAYINFESEGEVEKYFQLVKYSVENNDIQLLADQYYEYLLEQEKWTYDNVFGYLEHLCNNLHLKSKETVKVLSDIYIRNYIKYDKVWEIEKGNIVKRSKELNKRLLEEDYILKWENLTGLDFLYDKYEIVLCSANANGPDANSLGYERNLFYSGYDIDKTMEFISHEVGTHILIHIIKELWGQFHGQILYSAYESLVKFYNKIIFEEDQISYSLEQFNDNEFFHIYNEITEENSNIKGMELICEGIRRWELKKLEINIL